MCLDGSLESHHGPSGIMKPRAIQRVSGSTFRTRLGRSHTRRSANIPFDICTDAMNLYEMVVHSKALPNDKYHRVGILALREDRFCRRLRCMIHLPTQIMLADPLTKHMVMQTFMTYVTTGRWDTTVPDGTRVRVRRGVQRPQTYTEKDLIDNVYRDNDGSVGSQLEVSDALQLLFSTL